MVSSRNAIPVIRHVDDGIHRGIERAIAAIAAAVHLRVRRPAQDHQQNGWVGSGNDSHQIHRKPLFGLQTSAFGTVEIETKSLGFSKTRFLRCNLLHSGKVY